MRKVVEQTSQAFMNGTAISVGNTLVTVVDGETALHLHGNIIALKSAKGVVQISNKGYDTNVTKSRLNGILSYFNKKIIQKQGEWYLFDKDNKSVEFPYNEWVTIK